MASKHKYQDQHLYPSKVNIPRADFLQPVQAESQNEAQPIQTSSQKKRYGNK